MFGIWISHHSRRLCQSIHPSVYREGYSADQLFEIIYFAPTSIRCTHAKISSIKFLGTIFSVVRHKHDNANRISAILSHNCETDFPFPPSPNADANLSTHCTISCANRSAVALAPIAVCTKINIQNNILTTVTIGMAYRSQIYKVEQGLHETAYRDSAIRNEFQEVLVSINRCAGAIEYAIEGIFRMSLVPVFNFVEKILIKGPGLPWRRRRPGVGNWQRLM